MTSLLKKAFAKAAKLPQAIQNQLAREILDEIEAEAKWDKTLENSQEALETLAERALQEHRDGKTKELGFDEL